MRGDNKQKIIFWLIGFGCGIILSGVVMVGIVFNTTEYQQQLATRFSDSKETNNAASASVSETNSISPNQDTGKKEELQANSPIISSVDNSKKEVPDKSQTPEKSEIKQENKPKAEEKTVPKKIIAVSIPSNSNATEICELLQEKGVIKDADAFSKYVVAHQKTKRLRGGVEKEFPEDADYETVLKILTTK